MKRFFALGLSLALSGCGAAPTALVATQAAAKAPVAAAAIAPAPSVTVAAGPAAPSAPAAVDPVEMRAFEQAQATPNAFSVVTYNTGCADKSHAKQSLYAQLPMFQRVVNGAADAPIICTQETGPDLSDALEALQKKTKNFDLFWLTTTPFHQGNLMIVPKRFTVIAHDEDHFGGRLAQIVSNLFDHKQDNWSQTLEHRGYMWAQLVDSQTGKFFTVIDTHISYWADIRARQASQLRDAVAKAEAKGPVIVCGDFNTPTLDTMNKPNAAVEKFWNTLAPVGLTDMGPKGQDGISDWGSAQDIDHVLAKGFTSLHTHMYRDSELSLAGYADAKALSDHYPEEDVIAFQ